MIMKTVQDYAKILDKVKNFDTDSITELDIIDTICDFGLSYDDRNLYGTYEGHMNNPRDLGLWQKPDQLASLIKYLLDKNHTIDSFLEVGTYKASTFLILREFLLLKNNNLFSMTIDPSKQVSEEFISFFNINYKQSSIHDLQGRYDLIFIDGDHAYDSAKSDYEKALSLGPKYILFHDIQDKYCPGVVALWNEIKSAGMNNVEFNTNDNIMGLGLAILK